MSWSLFCSGTPSALKAELDRQSATLTGASLDEFQDAKPGLVTLLDCNKATPESLMTLEASGHRYASNGQAYSTCNVKLTPFIGGRFIAAVAGGCYVGTDGKGYVDAAAAKAAGAAVLMLMLTLCLWASPAAAQQPGKLPARVETNQPNPPVPYFAGGPGSVTTHATAAAPASCSACDASATRGARVAGEPVRNIGRGAAKLGAKAGKVATAPLRWLFRRRCG